MLFRSILRAVPGSRFLIKCKQLRDERVQARIRADFARHGIDPARVEMAVDGLGVLVVRVGR